MKACGQDRYGRILGNYQSMLNDTLRKHIERQEQPLEEVLGRVVREELRATQ
jgi:hypothetical protein